MIRRLYFVALVLAALALISWGAYSVWRPHVRAPEQSVAPDYKAALRISPGMPGDERANLNMQLKAVTEALDATTTDVNAWIALGVVRKGAGDYEGAEEVLLYVTSRWPTSTVAFNNLGDLYLHYLKEYPKAEESYTRLKELDPHNIDAYANLYELYHRFYKTDTSAAADILAQGLAANPGNQYLLSLKEELDSGK